MWLCSIRSRRDSPPLTGGRTRSTLNQVWRNLSRSFMKTDESPDVWRAFYFIFIYYWHRHEHLILESLLGTQCPVSKRKSNESSMCSDRLTNSTKLMCYWKTLSDRMAIFRSYGMLILFFLFSSHFLRVFTVLPMCKIPI